MAGDGPARAELEARIAELGLASRITLVGAQPARAMFARGRAVVVPSLAESLPYVVLEAAAAGLPVIATKVGGIAEIFGPTAGSLLPPGDAEALARAMSRVLDDPASAQRRGERAAGPCPRRVFGGCDDRRDRGHLPQGAGRAAVTVSVW